MRYLWLGDVCAGEVAHNGTYALPGRVTDQKRPDRVFSLFWIGGILILLSVFVIVSLLVEAAASQ